MWAHQILSLVHRWLPEHDITLLGDTAYRVLELGLHAKARRVTLIATGQPDVVLHKPPPEHTGQTMGRPRVKGTRLPALEQVLTSPETVWQKLTMAWYGQGERVGRHLHRDGVVVSLWLRSVPHSLGAHA